MNSSVRALRQKFSEGDAIGRALTSCGDTIVYVARESLPDVMTFLKEAPEQDYNYLVDVTAVEYRDAERALEVVYELFSLARRKQLRVKVDLPET